MKDLSKYLAPDLELSLGQYGTFRVPPVDHATGLKLTAMTTFGLQVAVDSKAEPSEEIAKLIAEADSPDALTRWCLGPALDEMIAAGVPHAHIERAANYAMYAHALGEEAADALFESIHGDQPGDGGAPGEPSTAPKRGPRTASASQTSTGSTPGTARSRATSGRSTAKNKTTDRPSRGSSSSSTGRSSR